MTSLSSLLSVPIYCLRYPVQKIGFLLIVGLLSGDFPAWAQTLNGKHLVGMQVGELNFSLRDNRASFMTLSPAYGKFVSSNLAFGLELPFYYSRNTQPLNRATHIALTPFVRYYIGQGRVKPFLSVLAGPRYISTRRYIPVPGKTETVSYTDLLYGARGGVAFFLNGWVSLDLSLSYTETNKEAVDDFYARDNALGYDQANRLAANLGFQIYLGKNRR
ncbi:hypothetical protein [Salmonirosea aquatica]|uniref:Outer membrane beta-barrel protein n=1 Tax=Salmonirosea aquatica TaxID=2654236 RepID=A0A7C9G065_9BACT|nr:hypothetical protein [Cytophagaceae bacterium SJW1-29]